LGIGVIQAILRESGKTPSLIHLLNSSASHLATTVLASLRNLDGISGVARVWAARGGP